MMNPQADKLVKHLVACGIRDTQVLNAIYSVPREHFVPQVMLHQAYDNNALPIGYGQTISQPYIVAKMTEMLGLTHSSKVLEIGTGSGYQTAVLASLVEQVYSIERIKDLQWKAKRRLKQLDIYNVSTKHSDGWLGWDAKAPFDAIIVTAAADVVPEALKAQLSEGGVLVIPIGTSDQVLMRITRNGDEYVSEVIEMVRFVPLIAGDLA